MPRRTLVLDCRHRRRAISSGTRGSAATGARARTRRARTRRARTRRARTRRSSGSGARAGADCNSGPRCARTRTCRVARAVGPAC